MLMKSWQSSLLLPLALIFHLVGLGCGGSSKALPAELSISAGSSLPTGRVGIAYSTTLSAAGGTAPYNWSVASGSLPSGLSLSSSGLISGTPAGVGTSSFTVQVTDTESTPQRTTAPLIITIAAPPLAITTTALPSAIENTPYTASLTATGGVTPYVWSIASGTLPPGLTLNVGGSVTGIPTTAGTVSFAVQVADAESTPQTATAELSITIASPPLTITTTLLPAAIETIAYTASLTAAGGVAPYVWSIAGGTLPPGLSLGTDGSITGVPTTLGSDSFTVEVADAESTPQTATAQLTITVTSRLAVTTEHYDNLRTGQNLVETVLTPSKVSSGNFGKLFSDAVDGYVYAQPLYLQSVAIPGKGVHNVLFVATEHDSVYAWDADSNSGQNATPLWQVSFINPAQGVTTVPSSDINCQNLVPEIGITSTPVMDTTTNTIYLVVETKENGAYFQRLHALDLTTGSEKFGGPIVITATYPGNGDGSSGGILTFDPLKELNRAGLLLNNGNIYITWASNCDEDPYHGWVIAYDETTLHQTSVWMTTPNGMRGGVWMSGGGIATDSAGNLFVATGNGTFETSGQPTDFGDSIVKLSAGNGALGLSDYFTPYDQGSLNEGDQDVGSGGVLLLPDQPGAHIHELIEAGKGKTVYVVDRDNMGHFNANNNDQIVQSLTGQVGKVFAVPTYWNNNVYLGAVSDTLKAFSLSDGLLSSQPISQSSASFTFPGASTSVSANGSQSGIIWAIQSDQYRNNGHDILYAFDATNLATELYSTLQDPTRDDPGEAVKFQIPVVANGKVYVGALQQISVYGVLP